MSQTSQTGARLPNFRQQQQISHGSVGQILQFFQFSTKHPCSHDLFHEPSESTSLIPFAFASFQHGCVPHQAKGRQSSELAKIHSNGVHLQLQCDGLEVGCYWLARAPSKEGVADIRSFAQYILRQKQSHRTIEEQHATRRSHLSSSRFGCIMLVRPLLMS